MERINSQRLEPIHVDSEDECMITAFVCPLGSCRILKDLSNVFKEEDSDSTESDTCTVAAGDSKAQVSPSGKDVMDNVSALKILLAPDCKTSALSCLPAGIVTDKILIVDMLQIKDDWQDDHR
ncbi:Hypothetical predicted protein [Paramuricea clavata]|uniref:Uncharacterized protein n=1 Tax=Paramuricea clavata TaxID=317549 RepID=A0A6S7J566_PARCT|nr:Hypothetical predicted protein [Paramuricea clavata]